MPKPRYLVLTLLHAGRKDRMVMRSLVNLISGRKNAASWEISEDVGGDITIVDVDSADGEQAYRGLLGETGALVAFTGRPDFQASEILSKPLRSREFLDVLGRISQSEALTVVGASASAPEAGIPAGSATETDVAPAPEDSGRELTLADHLRCQTWSSPVALNSRGWPVLLLDPCSGTWFYDGSIGDLAPASFERTLPASAGVSLSNSELVERIHGHRQRALSELKWYAGLAQLPGRLHPELLGDPQFMLTQVPPEAMKNELLHQLARITLRGPIDFEGLLDESGQPEANVSAFLNACFCSGRLLVNRTGRLASF